MRLSFGLIVMAVLLSGCAKQSDLDAANANLAAANAQLATANANLTTANQNIEDLKTQVAAMQAQNHELDAQLSVKPKLPVTLAVHKIFLTNSLTAVFNTTMKAPIQVLATVRNPTLGTVKEVELHLNPNAPTNIGAPQGVPIDQGDVIVLTNNNYSPASYVVNAPR